ncbi:MAG: glycosyltransferase family 87 protein [Bacteroidota bacterium]
MFLHKVKPVHVILVAYTVWVLTLKFRTIGGSDDFNVFFNAGQRLLNGANIYGEPYYMNLRYFYSPLFAGFLSVFANFDVEYVKTLWFALNVLLLLRFIFIIKHFVKWNFKGHTLALLILMLITGKIVLTNFLTNQISIFMLWAILESFLLCKKGKWMWSVLILCIGINIKILPIMVLPFYLLFTDHKLRFVTTSIAVSIALLLIPALWTGWTYNLFLTSEWLTLVSPVNHLHIIQVYEGGFLDIGALLSKYLSGETVLNEPVLNIVSLDAMVIFFITNGLRISLLLLTILVVRKVKSNPFSIDQSFVQLTPFIALIPLLLPHQRDYSFLFFVPLLAVLVAFLVNLNKIWHYIIFAFLCLLGGMFTWADITGSDIVDVFMHYRLVTIGMLLMLLFYLTLLHYYARGYWTEFSEVN